MYIYICIYIYIHIHARTCVCKKDKHRTFRISTELKTKIHLKNSFKSYKHTIKLCIKIIFKVHTGVIWLCNLANYLETSRERSQLL